MVLDDGQCFEGFAQAHTVGNDTSPMGEYFVYGALNSVFLEFIEHVPHNSVDQLTLLGQQAFFFLICQEFIKGTEYTCDVYIDFDLNVRCVVPRKRIEVRTGEVSKGQVIKNKRIMKQAASLTEKLGAGPGVITLQLFLTGRREIKFVEINPRFGGGAPLSIKAGADFPKWILQELSGKKPKIYFNSFEDKLIMLRYDSEVWIQGS